jgi:splicing factor, arginine/serine-rich 18
MFSNNATTKAPDTPAAPTWPLNPAIYANMATMDVDWATLAQQWIHMKVMESIQNGFFLLLIMISDQFKEQPGQQPENFPSAPPPPPLSGKDFEEKGEAPMEVDKDEEISSHISMTTQSQTNNKNNWNTTGANSGGNNTWNSAFPSSDVPQWKQSGWNPIFPGKESASEAKLNNSKRHQPTKNQSKTQPPNSQGYWTTKPPHKIPSLLDTIIEPDPSLVSAIPRIMAHHSDDDEDDDTTQTIDAAKRKTLPAWIREGLEKMEREKQKQVEKEDEMRDREKRRAIRRQIEEEALKEMENEKNMLPAKSKFVSN